MIPRATLVVVVLVTCLPAFAQQDRPYGKIHISTKYWSEGAGIGDFNCDQVGDVVCGPYWYAGPDFKAKHEIYEGKSFPNDRLYSNNFFSFGYDINDDGWDDVLTIGFPGQAAHWFENPRHAATKWKKRIAFPHVDNESPTFADITGDGQPEIVCSYKRQLGYATFDKKSPDEVWEFHAISDTGPWNAFSHGLGIGDVNGDGKTDFLTATGWYEQPQDETAKPADDNAVTWRHHPFQFCPGGAQMFAYDVDGDGDNDVITSLQAHAYGLSWFENKKNAAGRITFTEHQIMGNKPEQNRFRVAFSQLHALALHDMDGDGLKDIVTGKCYWAHNGHDPGARNPAVIYYFKLTRGDHVEFVPTIVDDDSGVGRQISIGDLNNDTAPDIVCANKKGVFVFLQGIKTNPLSLDWPQLDSVESQPLLAQVDRLQATMDFIGSPLSDESIKQIADIKHRAPRDDTVEAVQDLLDPYCLLAIEVDSTGAVTTTRGAGKPELLQEGWRNFLVKVINRAEKEMPLYVSSPNAGDVPGATAEQGKERWLDVNMYNGRPMTPRLSGLQLEYRLLQVFSGQPGRNTGTLTFAVDAGQFAQPDESLLDEWTFEKDLGGWIGVQEAKLLDGTVRIGSKTGPAYIENRKLKGNPSGKLELRLWMKSPQGGRATVFWANGPIEKGNIGQAQFSLKASVSREYRVVVDAVEMTGIRLVVPSDSAIDWIRLARLADSATTSGSVAMPFDTVPATKVTLQIRDEKLQATTAALLIRDRKGRVYPTQSKRLAPDFFFHPQIYRRDQETVALPPGKYSVKCWRGPESIVEMKELIVGNEPTTLEYSVKRWVDPAQFDWYSGDHHIHAAGCAHYQNPTQGVHARDMARHCMGEDLKVGCNLTWGPCFDYQKQFFTGQVDQESVYPYLLRYDVEVSGFGSHSSGHLCLLRLREQIFPGGDSKDHWPTLGLNTLKWAKSQGAICGPAHSSAGLAPSEDRVDGTDGPPLAGWNQSGMQNLPNHFIPRYDGIGANEYIVDVTHKVPGPDGKLVRAIDFISSMNTNRVAEWNMWYHTLNCGFRVKVSGETDFPCVTDDRVGIGRVYVKVKDRLEFDDWCQGITEGRSYVSDGSGHLIDLTARHADQIVELGLNGSELQLREPGRVTLNLKAAVRRDDHQNISIELIKNGYPVAHKIITANGTMHDVSFEVEVDKSSWLAVRSAAYAHTNPIFVVVGNKPIRASAASAEWCLMGVDRCWNTKKRTYADDEQSDAKAAYDHARTVYKKILVEAKAVN